MTISVDEYLDVPPARGDADAHDVATAFLRRIADHAHLKAVVAVNEHRAHDDADRVALARRAGHPLPLDGLPVLIKDNIDVADTLCQVGSPLFAGRIAPSDSRVARLLSDAGAIVLGKAALHELVYGGTTDSPFFGTTRNPWDLQRTVGGSSGGSGAAAAAGLCAVAIGSDTGGSIRLPAHANGVVGLRPTFGAVSTVGARPIGPSFDTIGPLARHARDAALVQAVIAGFDIDDPWAVDTREASRISLQRAILVDEETFGKIDQGVARCVAEGVQLLQTLGIRIKRRTLSGFDRAGTDTATIVRAEAWTRYGDDLARYPEKFSPDTAQRLRTGADISLTDLVAAQWRVREWRRQLRRLMVEEADYLVLPSVPVIAPITGTANMIETTATLTSLTAPISATHLPAISIPCGFSQRMPVGMQIVAGPGKEGDLLALAEAIQASQPPPRWPPAHRVHEPPGASP